MIKISVAQMRRMYGEKNYGKMRRRAGRVTERETQSCVASYCFIGAPE